MNRGDLAAYASAFAEDAKNSDQSIGREGVRIRVAPTQKHFDVQHW